MADALAITTVFAPFPNGFIDPGTVDVYDLTTNSEASGSPFTVGVEPDSVAFSPDNHWAAITNGGGTIPVNGSVQVIDLTTTPVTFQSPVTVGLGPAGVTFSPDSQTLYVLNSYAGTMDVLDLISGTWTLRSGAGYPVASSVTSPPYQTNVLWQTLTIYVDGSGGWWGFAPNAQGANTVDVFDLSATPPVLAYTIAVGNTPIATGLMGTNVLICNGGDNTVGVMDCTPLPGSTPIYGGSPIAVGNVPYWIAVNNAQTEAYVSNAVDNTVGIIDGSLTYTGTVSDTGSAIRQPVAGAFSPDDSTYYACSAGNNAVVTVDTGAASVTGSRTLGGLTSGIGVTPGTITPPPSGAGLMAWF